MAKVTSRLLFFIKLAVAAALLGTLIGLDQLDIHRVFQGLRRSGGFGLVIFGMILGDSVLTMLRWYPLIRCQGIAISVREAVRIGFIGMFFNSFMPGGVGGDAMKAYYAARGRPGRRIEAVTSLAVDRVVGLIGLLLLAGLAGLLNLTWILQRGSGEILALLVLIGACLAAALAGLIAVYLDIFRRIFEHDGLLSRLPFFDAIRRLYDALVVYRRHKRVLTLTLLYSVGLQMFFAFIAFLIGRTLGENVLPLSGYLMLVPLGVVCRAIPITPAGIGIGEVAFGKLFAMAGSMGGEEIALTLSIFVLLANQTGLFFYVTAKAEVDGIMGEGEAAGHA